MDDIEFIKYNITTHAQERFVERMMNKDNYTDIRRHIEKHACDIEERINKLINYGQLIFEGKIGKYNLCKYFYKDYWVVAVDPKTKNVITLYKINLGDDEVNDLFVNKMLARIKNEQDKLKDIEETAKNTVSSLRESIEDTNNEIAYYRKMIKSLEEVNDSYNILIKNANLEVEKQNKEISNLVEILIAKKQF